MGLRSVNSKVVTAVFQSTFLGIQSLFALEECQERRTLKSVWRKLNKLIFLTKYDNLLLCLTDGNWLNIFEHIFLLFPLSTLVLWDERRGWEWHSSVWSIIEPEISHLMLAFLETDTRHLPSWPWCHSKRWYLDISITLRDIFGHYKGVWHRDTAHKSQNITHCKRLEKTSRTRNYFSGSIRGYATYFFENEMPMSSSFSCQLPKSNLSFRSILFNWNSCLSEFQNSRMCKIIFDLYRSFVSPM